MSMTMAEVKAKARAEAEALVAEINQAIKSGDIAKTSALSDEIANAVDEHVAAAQKECFDMCLASPDPMRAAVTALSFETIAVKDVRQKESRIVLKELVEVNKPIDLFKLHKASPGGIGADPKNWIYYVEKMNFLLTARACVGLGINPKAVNDSYAMSDIAKALDMGKAPTSNTQVMKALQMVVTAMLGEGAKTISYDVKFLDLTYSKKSRTALTVSCANHRNFCRLMAEVCHRIVTGKNYAVEFKAKSNG